MKKLISLLISIFFCHFLFADILLNESFTAGVLPAGWTNTAQQGTAIWTIRNTPAFSSPSGGNYVVFDDFGLGSAVTPNEATLTTPIVDFSNRSTAFLKISHHWFGVEFTHGYIEISNNGGVSWTQLIDYEKITRGSLAAPQDTTFDITAIAANQANVQVRFRYTDGGQAGRFWYLDDIVLYSNPDVGVSKLILPNYLGCAQSYGATETVTVEITNYSFEPITNIPVTCEITGGTSATLTGTYTGPLIPGGATANFTFATPINMTADAIYHFLSYTTLSNDSYALNDSLFDGRQQLVAIYPYTADFNISNSGWLATGQAPPLNNGRNFIHGNVPYLNGPQGQGKSFYIESTAPYYSSTQIWVESPIFDFTGLISPQLSMDIKHSLHSSDWVKVEYSINGGTSWTQLGNSSSPNWYNQTNYWANSQAAPVDAWTQVQHNLCMLAGQTCVKFRVLARPYYGNPNYPTWYNFAFDNFTVREGIDVGVLTYIDPVDVGCLFNTTQQVTVTVYNGGCNPITNVPIQCDITGQITTTLTGTVPGPIPVGGTVSYTFPTTFNMTNVGTYNFNTYTQLAGDINSNNDTLATSINVTNLKVTTYPYFEDFNSGAGFWNASGQNPPGNGGRNWLLGNVPYLGGPQGNGDSWYIETVAPYYDGTQIWVESPVFDFTNLTNPKLSFDIKHSLHSSDWVRVEYSTNGGTTWAQLGNGPNATWYNQTNYWANSQAAPVANWTHMEQELCVLSGEPCVKFRILARPYYGNPNYPNWYNFAFDNFEIDAGHPDDMQPLEIILSDARDCASFGAAETISVVVANNTCRPLYNVPISLQLNGGPIINETIPGPVPSFGNYIYTFTNTLDLSPAITHNISVTTLLATDSFPANDNLVETRINNPLNTFPYLADFNTNNDGWVSRINSTTNASRLFINDTIPYLNGAQGQGKSWYIESTAPYYTSTQIWIESPVFNFSTLTSPQLSMDIKHSLHSSDWVKVEYSTNGGTSWTQLGNSSSPNWYNQTNYWANSQAAPVDAWTQVQHNLCMLAGQACVKFRVLARPYYGNPNYPNWYNFAFDNFEIKDGPDVGVVAYIDPVDVGCLFSQTQQVTVTVYNWGCTPATNVPIQCNITGALTSTLVGTVPGPIPVGGSVNYTFPTTFNMTNLGVYNFNTFTSLPGDINPQNDALATSINVNILKVTTFPYFEDFNSGAGFWNASGQNPPGNGGRNWLLGNVPYLGGPQGNGDSWYIETVAPYYDGTQIWVESPVFDFTNLTNPKLSFDIKHSLHSSDWVKVEYSTNGGTTWAQLGSGPNATWYNQTNYWANSQAAPMANWTHMEQELCVLSGEPCVKFRILARPYYGNPNYPNWYNFAFDNFSIDAGHPDDMQPLEIILSDARDCASFGAAETISVVVANNTCRPLYNVPISLQLNGGPIINETMPGPVPSFGNYIYTFTNTLDLSPAITHNISVTTLLATDSFPANDNLIETRINTILNTFPYLANFNTNNDGWVSRINSTTNASRLFINDTIPYLNGSQGQGKSWYIESTAPYYTSTQIWVESPVFNFSTLTSPQLSMDIKHSLHSSDWVKVEYSTNGGTSWTQLGNSSSPNWYNQTNYWANSQAAPVDAWTQVQHNLCMLAGQACVKFRVLARPYYGNPNYPNWYNFAFDNFYIREGGDVGVVAYIEPLSSGCLYDSTQQVTVRVFNGSCNPISNVPIQCDVTGQVVTTLSGTVPGPIPVGGFINYTFPTTINMTPIGTYNFNTFTLLPGDINPSNDTLATSINVNQITISSFPYYEDFNSGNGYWLASGQNPPGNGGRNWLLGNIPYLNGPQGNGDSWYIETTTPYYDGTQIWIESPVFDFTNLLNPQLSFDIKHSLHSSDWVRVEYSINGGNTWVILGNGPNATWYNQTNNWSNSQASPVDTWTKMERDLCTLVGQSCVKFRVLARPYYGNPNYPNWYNFAFDNFHITDTPLDAALTLVASCWGSEYEIEATVTNNALPCTATPILSNFDITYSIDGGTPVTVSFSGQNIAGGTSATVTLLNTLIPNNNSSVVAWINFPNSFNDQIFQNDTAYGYAVSWPNCNDHCSNAIDLGLGTTTATQTSNATVNLSEEPAFSGCGGITLENTVWYQFTTNSSGDSVTIIFDNQVCSPSQNGIQVSIVQATVSCDPMTYSEIFCSASNDTTAFQFGPVLLPPNTTYYIAVDGFAGSDCDFDITIEGAVNPPLPIELISFDATCAPTNGAVDLKWLSATEINNDFYTIEKSSDAINFEVVATIRGGGNSNNINSYFFRDVNPINGTSYYRLKQTDFNGNFEYFDMVAVNCANSTSGISLYPNPANNEFTVQLEGEKGNEISIEIYNSIGQQVMSKTFILQDKFLSEQIDVNEFNQGIYFVNIKVENLLTSKKLIIDRKK